MSLYKSITVNAEIGRSLIDVVVDLDNDSIKTDAEINETIIEVDAVLEKGVINASTDLEKNTIYVDAEIINQIRSDHEHFDGPYILIPKTEDQMLYTNNKIMDNDVIVTAIPYTEVSNLSGGLTVSIA